ncbi:MAG: AarF/ABC1/UbiB kinase family protein, partial [Desulfobacterales bacterium]|nr:AarF/ABC1/UbiB kinase family protein [Desulfobacterales bacterium]
MLSIRRLNAAGLTYRHFARYRQIITALFKYGFEDVLGAFKVDKYLEVILQMISARRKELLTKYTRFERARMALEELGPTFIKLGQALSMRPDFISIEFIDELAKLQDSVPAFSYADIKETFRTEFNASIEDIFESFEKIPIASASIGQVHKARLKDGREAAVKVQRPGLDRLVEVDLGIMLHLAGIIEKNIEEIAFIRPVKIIEEFARIISKELDYTIEADHMERFAKTFAEDQTLHIPKVYRDFSTRRILTMEYIDGIKVSDIPSLDKAGTDKQLVTFRGANLLLKQIFDNGFFHSDPHSGNIFILPGNVIALLDFGQAGTVDQQSKEEFVDLIDSVVQQNAFKATRQLLKITYWDKKPDIRLLEREVSDFIGKHLYKTLKDLNINELVHDLLHMMSRHQLRIPPDIFLMMKALATIEGIARKLDPDFDMIAQATPFIKQIKIERLKPQRIIEDIYHLSGDLIYFAKHFPA